MLSLETTLVEEENILITMTSKQGEQDEEPFSPRWKTVTYSKYPEGQLPQPNPLDHPGDEKVPALGALDGRLIEVECVLPHQVEAVEGVEPQQQGQHYDDALAEAIVLQQEMKPSIYLTLGYGPASHKIVVYNPSFLLLVVVGC